MSIRVSSDAIFDLPRNTPCKCTSGLRLHHCRCAFKFRSLTYSYSQICGPGGGTAGCVLANRLSQDPNVTVLLVERGGVKNSFVSRIPLLSSHFASDGSRSHLALSTPQMHLDERQLEIISGNSLGGASKINAMMYTRGLPAEYNLWEAMGNTGWGYKDILPQFIKGEKLIDRSAQSKLAWHGTKGFYFYFYLPTWPRSLTYF